MSQQIQGVTVPSFLYGTAWKEDATERLTSLALQAGFRGIDTANQRRHYFEAGVGAALRKAFADGLVKRQELFLQTKFTYQRGQDHRLPYDPAADFATQVRQSFASSLEHLGVETLDSYVLHGPYSGHGIQAADREVWSAMEELCQSGRTRLLGVSNVSYTQLEALCKAATVLPAFVQNRCYGSDGWDAAVRELCRDKGIVYQGFSLLTANRGALAHPAVQAAAQRLERTPAQIIFCFALERGMLPLTGTSDPVHMRQDLACDAHSLRPDELHAIKNCLV